MKILMNDEIRMLKDYQKERVAQRWSGRGEQHFHVCAVELHELVEDAAVASRARAVVAAHIETRHGDRLQAESDGERQRVEPSFAFQR